MTPEDLIVMKAIAHRPCDIADIEAVVAMHPRLDRARVLRWVREFAGILEAPELASDVERLLARKRRRRAPARPRRRRPRT